VSVCSKFKKVHFSSDFSTSLALTMSDGHAGMTLGEIDGECDITKFACSLHTLRGASTHPAAVRKTFQPLAYADANLLTTKG